VSITAEAVLCLHDSCPSIVEVARRCQQSAIAARRFLESSPFRIYELVRVLKPSLPEHRSTSQVPHVDSETYTIVRFKLLKSRNQNLAGFRVNHRFVLRSIMQA